MFTKKHDPLVDSVRKVMEQNELRRRVEFALNEELGISSRKAVPHEHLASYDAMFEKALNEAEDYSKDFHVVGPHGRTVEVTTSEKSAEKAAKEYGEGYKVYRGDNLPSNWKGSGTGSKMFAGNKKLDENALIRLGAEAAKALAKRPTTAVRTPGREVGPYTGRPDPAWGGKLKSTDVPKTPISGPKTPGPGVAFKTPTPEEPEVTQKPVEPVNKKPTDNTNPNSTVYTRLGDGRFINVKGGPAEDLPVQNTGKVVFAKYTMGPDGKLVGSGMASVQQPKDASSSPSSPSSPKEYLRHVGTYNVNTGSDSGTEPNKPSDTDAEKADAAKEKEIADLVKKGEITPMVSEKVRMTKADIAGMRAPRNKVDAGDLAALRRGEHKLEEKLTKSMSAGDVISDFVHSKNPKFKGKSKKERMKMALGAYYSKHPEKSKKMDESLESIMEEIRANLEEKLVSVYESGDAQMFEEFVSSLTEEQLELLGLSEALGDVFGGPGSTERQSILNRASQQTYSNQQRQAAGQRTVSSARPTAAPTAAPTARPSGAPAAGRPTPSAAPAAGRPAPAAGTSTTAKPVPPASADFDYLGQQQKAAADATAAQKAGYGPEGPSGPHPGNITAGRSRTTDRGILGIDRSVPIPTVKPSDIPSVGSSPTGSVPGKTTSDIVKTVPTEQPKKQQPAPPPSIGDMVPMAESTHLKESLESMIRSRYLKG